MYVGHLELIMLVLPLQLLVEKALNNEGVDSSKLSNDQLIEKIWDWKQKNEIKSLSNLKVGTKLQLVQSKIYIR